ncbi:MAG: alpha/beta hydrolase [Candidatus Hydrogenedentes bacterium]|nr:alpha/beta hydrolase [Candidatus Hydrogenedentota bacterium]
MGPDIAESSADAECYRQAQALYREGKFVQALAVLKRLQSTYPRDETIAKAIAKCWTAAEAHDAAVADAATRSGRDEAPVALRTDPRVRAALLSTFVCVVAALVFAVATMWPSGSGDDVVGTGKSARLPATNHDARAATAPQPAKPKPAPADPRATTPPAKVLWVAKVESDIGGIRTLSTPYGRYLDYVPASAGPGSHVIALVHGSPDASKDIRDLAALFIRHEAWLALADATGSILVAPCFDVANFGGYRHLKGKRIGADQFLIRIADEYLQQYSPYDRRMTLYGHSAGGQFAARFAVTHPERLRAVCLSAPGNYPRPSKDIEWPYGIKNCPNPAGFVLANIVPMAVVVGELDTDTDPGAMGGQYQVGANRVERALRWVDAMREYAQLNDQTSRTELIVVSGIGHSSAGLTGTCIAWMTR